MRFPLNTFPIRVAACTTSTAIILLASSAVSSIAAQPNAWQIRDDSIAAGSLINYSTNLTAAQKLDATNAGFRFTTTARLSRDFGSAGPSMSFIYGNGTRRYGIGFDLNPSGHLVATLFGSSNVTVTTDSSLATNYHTHRIDYAPDTQMAVYRCDGLVLATWPGEVSAAQNGVAQWGGASSADRGEMNFHRAVFEISGQGSIATYDAGISGNPVSAPAPTSQAWTRTAGATAIFEGPLSPDTVFLPPSVVTGNAAPTRPGQVTLNATINPNGLPTTFWFEYGSSTDYGSFSDTSSLATASASAAVNSLLTGLPRGVVRQFRVVATNAAGRMAGDNAKFTVPQGQFVNSSSTGASQPFDIRQPSLELNFIICMNGIFPSPSGTPMPPFVGEIRLFAGNYAPAGWELCHGQLLNIADNETLFFVIGTTYGGNGQTTFALPDLRSRTIVGTGSGLHGASWLISETAGWDQTQWLLSQLPNHTHSLPPPDAATGPAGSSSQMPIRQPSIALSCLIAVIGSFPHSDETVLEPVLAQFFLFAGNYSFSFYPFASGQLLPINQNQALFSLLGITYGGNGVTTFALPNLNGRTPMGMGGPPQPTSWALGQVTGSENATASTNRMPAHEHAASSLGVLTGSSGGGLPIDLMQPSLAIRYLIATNGDFPSTTNQAVNQMIGQIQLFAGSATGTGWMPCEGQLLFITNNPILFSIIGTNYGGNGTSTFALPNLAGRIPVGAPTGQPGATYGVQQRVLTTAEMPAHTHSVPSLDFDRWISSFGISNNAAAFHADADGDLVRNGFEWATGSNPTNSTSGDRLRIGLNGNMASLQFSRNTNATDVTFRLQRTTNLSDSIGWSGLATNAGGLWIGPALESGSSNPVNVSISDPRTNPAAHYRLQLNLP